MSPSRRLSRQLKPRVDAHPQCLFVIIARHPPPAHTFEVARQLACTDERRERVILVLQKTRRVCRMYASVL